jgi:hypothetical protein
VLDARSSQTLSSRELFLDIISLTAAAQQTPIPERQLQGRQGTISMACLLRVSARSNVMAS